MSDTEVVLFLVAAGSAIVSCILFVILGQVTVRKLRKNPATRHHLGVEFASGLDILNVSIALSRPRRLNRVLESGPWAGLYANSRLLHAHTNRLDRFLARALCASLMFALVWLTGLMVVDKLH